MQIRHQGIVFTSSYLHLALKVHAYDIEWCRDIFLHMKPPSSMWEMSDMSLRGLLVVDINI
jgi:hypothetical protein